MKNKNYELVHVVFLRSLIESREELQITLAILIEAVERVVKEFDNCEDVITLELVESIDKLSTLLVVTQEN